MPLPGNYRYNCGVSERVSEEKRETNASACFINRENRVTGVNKAADGVRH